MAQCFSRFLSGRSFEIWWFFRGASRSGIQSFLFCFQGILEDYPPKSNIDTKNDVVFYKCTSFQIWLFGVSMLVFGGVRQIKLESNKDGARVSNFRDLPMKRIQY